MEIKTSDEIKLMAEGGQKLYEIKLELRELIKDGITTLEIENKADQLIKSAGGKASFKMVPGYSWATCININAGVVHGVPKSQVSIKNNDIVSVDVGFYYKGFHTDSAFSVSVGKSSEMKKFLDSGKEALKDAIKATKKGNRIYDISKAIEDSLRKNSLFPIKALVGHGVGESLHEEPHIPCFVSRPKNETPEIREGAVYAIEVMYTGGRPGIKVLDDGWTINTRDGKISGLFEETVAVAKGGPIILTDLGFLKHSNLK